MREIRCTLFSGVRAVVWYGVRRSVDFSVELRCVIHCAHDNNIQSIVHSLDSIYFMNTPLSANDFNGPYFLAFLYPERIHENSS